jgi:hypothetical protein
VTINLLHWEAPPFGAGPAGLVRLPPIRAHGAERVARRCVKARLDRTQLLCQHVLGWGAAEILEKRWS